MSDIEPAISENVPDKQLKDPAAWEKSFREEFENIEQPDKPDSAQTTVIRGQNKWATCWRDACYLAKYIYKLPANPDFFTEFPEEMEKVVERWEPWGELLDDKDSGLMGQLFKSKGYDPASEKALCPPVLVFRGTDFDDFRDIAIRLSIKLFHISPSSGELRQTNQLQYTFSPAVPEKNGVSFFKLSDDDFLELGYRKFPIFDEPPSILSASLAKIGGLPVFGMDLVVSVELAVFAKEDGDWCNNFVQGIGEPSKQYEGAIEYGRSIAEGKIQTSFDKRLEISGHSLGGGLASAVCCVLNDEYPDIHVHGIVFNAAGVHVNTIARALGSEKQAHGAISSNPAIDICVRDEILTALSVNYQKLPLIGAVFNMAERHLKQRGFPPPIARQFEIRGFSSGTVAEDVHHEGKNREQEKKHLNKMEEYHQKAAIWSEEISRMQPNPNGSYPAVMNPPRMNLDPGKPPVEPRPAKSANLGEKWSVLPILFSIDEQTAVSPPKPDGFPVIRGLDGVFSSSANVMMAANRLIEYLDRQYVDPARKNNRMFWNSLSEGWEKLKADIMPEVEALMEIMKLSSAYHGMDIVIASYEMHLRSSEFKTAGPGYANMNSDGI